MRRPHAPLTFFQLCPSSEKWRIVEASRDYPYNDERVAKGDYDILMAIPEKFAAYLAGGSRVLNQCGLIVADELQFLTTQRGPNIESLLTVIRANHPHIPLLALSAPLTAESADAIEHWLGVDQGPAPERIETEIRPVPLARYVFTASEWRGRDTHNNLVDGRWDLRSKSESWIKDLKSDRHRYRDTIALVVDLLARAHAEGEERSVLVFVGGRADAERVAEAIQDALDTSDLPSPGHQPTAWRFAGEMTAEAAEAWERDLSGLPDLPATRHIMRGLGAGIVYHTARLDPEHRRLIERAYTRERVIRVIVATATLAIGINLPADYVIISDLIETSGGSWIGDGRPGQRVLEAHEIGQRLGRCGRLGRSTSGHAYVAVPSDVAGDRIQLTDEQTANLALSRDKTVSTTLEQARQAALGALSDPSAIFRTLVDHEVVGEPVSSRLDEGAFARLLLQDMCRHGLALSDEELDAKAATIYENSLLRAESRSPYAIGRLVRQLEERSLIGHPDHGANKWAVSGLGRAIAFSNLPIENASNIAKVADAAQMGAGPLTILATAADAPHVREMHWVNLPSHRPTLVADVRSRIRTLVASFVSPSQTPQSLMTELVDATFLGALQANLVGTGPAADALERRGADATLATSDERLIADFRACLAYLWMNGLPMVSLLSFAHRNTEVVISRKGRGNDRAKIAAYPADVRDPGERLSYIVNAASETLRARPSGGRYPMLQSIGESLEVGLPYQLAPLTWLREPRIHRERLATLLSMRMKELDFDNIPNVLDTLSTAR